MTVGCTLHVCGLHGGGTRPGGFGGRRDTEPAENYPRAANLVFYLLIDLYVVGVLYVGIICSGHDSGLPCVIKIGEGTVAASLWVIAIHNLGIRGLIS